MEQNQNLVSRTLKDLDGWDNKNFDPTKLKYIIMENTTKEAAKKFCNIRENVDPGDAEERYYQDFNKYDGFIAGANWMREQKLSQFEEMKTALEKIANTSFDKGVPGCTYNDTDYDSESAAYGYNQAVEYARRDALKVLASLENSNKNNDEKPNAFNPDKLK